MHTYEEALAAKKKFKEEYWAKNPERYNIIAIDADMEYNLDIETDEAELIMEDFCVKAYLFDMLDVKDLPAFIDGVEIRYLPVMKKKEL